MSKPSKSNKFGGHGRQGGWKHGGANTTKRKNYDVAELRSATFTQRERIIENGRKHKPPGPAQPAFMGKRNHQLSDADFTEIYNVDSTSYINGSDFRMRAIYARMKFSKQIRANHSTWLFEVRKRGSKPKWKNNPNPSFTSGDFYDAIEKDVTANPNFWSDNFDEYGNVKYSYVKQREANVRAQRLKVKQNVRNTHKPASQLNGSHGEATNTDDLEVCMHCMCEVKSPNRVFRHGCCDTTLCTQCVVRHGHHQLHNDKRSRDIGVNCISCKKLFELPPKLMVNLLKGSSVKQYCVKKKEKLYTEFGVRDVLEDLEEGKETDELVQPLLDETKSEENVMAYVRTDVNYDSIENQIPHVSDGNRVDIPPSEAARNNEVYYGDTTIQDIEGCIQFYTGSDDCCNISGVFTLGARHAGDQGVIKKKIYVLYNWLYFVRTIFIIELIIALCFLDYWIMCNPVSWLVSTVVTCAIYCVMIISDRRLLIPTYGIPMLPILGYTGYVYAYVHMPTVKFLFHKVVGANTYNKDLLRFMTQTLNGQECRCELSYQMRHYTVVYAFQKILAMRASEGNHSRGSDGSVLIRF
jgi:hypothetical protein